MEEHDRCKEWEFDHLTVWTCCHKSNQQGQFSNSMRCSKGLHQCTLPKSVDYAVIMEGEMEMHLDDGSCTILRQGA